MGRRSRFVVGVLSLTVVLLAVAAAAMAAPIAPKDGRYSAYEKGQTGSGVQYFNVTGGGRKVTFELSLAVICEARSGRSKPARRSPRRSSNQAARSAR